MNSLFLALAIGFGLIRSDYGPLPQVSSSTKSTFLTKKDSTQRMSIDGLYKSNSYSFRNNFYVQIAGESVTLYGWELGLNRDTVYYRTNTVNTDTGKVNWKFENYEFTSKPISSDNIGGFTADTSINFFTPSLHNYFFGEFSTGMFKLIAVKGIYDSRADVFEFVKVE